MRGTGKGEGFGGEGALGGGGVGVGDDDVTEFVVGVAGSGDSEVSGSSGADGRIAWGWSVGRREEGVEG